MKYALLIFVSAFVLVFVAEAKAYGDPRLDVVATAVAGHPVTVDCASGAMQWADTERAAGLAFETDGFTRIGYENVVHLSPEICDTLESDYRFGVAAVGDLANGRAIKVLLHESSHQAGFTDEGQTDCRALSLVKQYAPAFGYAKTVVQVSYVRKGKLYARMTKTVPNPALNRVYAWALVWHRLLPANYQGAC